MNTINLIGRITKELEMKTNNNGTNYVPFTLAVDDFNGKEKIAQFIPCIAFSKTAETIIAYCKKGQKIAVEGKLNVRFDKERNTTIVSVPVHKIHFIESKQQEQTFNSPAQERASKYQDNRQRPDSEIRENESILWED